MRKLCCILLSFFIFASGVVPVLAVNPDEVLEDPALETRARALSLQIRCLVCQNQSIDDSDAQLARDLRIIVREKLTEGLSDQQILDFLVERYGEFVLLKPRFNAGTAILWIAPFAILGVAGTLIFLRSRNSAKHQERASALSDDEKKALADLLDDSETTSRNP